MHRAGQRDRLLLVPFHQRRHERHVRLLPHQLYQSKEPVAGVWWAGPTAGWLLGRDLRARLHLTRMRPLPYRSPDFGQLGQVAQDEPVNWQSGDDARDQ